MHAIERTAERLLDELGIAGFARYPGVLRLIDHCRDVRLKMREPWEPGDCRYWKDGSATVWSPRARALLTAHEVGHALNDSGLAALLEDAGSPTWQREQLRSEHLATQFGLYFLLPRRLLGEYVDEWSIVSASGCDLQTVQLRLKTLELRIHPWEKSDYELRPVQWSREEL